VEVKPFFGFDDFSEICSKENGLSYKGPYSYPILNKNFRRDYLSFWNKAIDQTKEYLLFKDYVLNSIKFWLISLSGSPVRSFRHTASVTAMEFVHIISKILAEIGRKKQKIAVQLEGTRNGQVRKSLAGKQEAFENQIQSLFQTVSDLFNGYSFFHSFMVMISTVYQSIFKKIP
jgi:hypothetical protein